MENDKCYVYMAQVNRVLLGLTMLVAGILKLFVIKPAGVVGMLTSLGFPAPSVLTWVLIVVELLAGIAFLADKYLKYASIGAAIVLILAAFTAYKGQWSTILLHLTAASNYIMVASKTCDKHPMEKSGKKK